MTSNSAVWGVVLAAGASTRMGAPKQLVALDGAPLLPRIVSRATASRCRRVGVVLGAHAEAVARSMTALAAGADAVTLLSNAAWREGMASSLRVAVAWAAGDQSCKGLLVMLCDQPRLSTRHLDALVSAFEVEGGDRAIGSAYAGTIGVPAVIPRALFSDLSRLRGDQGARALLRANGVSAVPWEDGAFDLDTKADLARLTK